MDSFTKEDEEIKPPSSLANKTTWFFAHSALAVGSWLALMMLGQVFNPPGIPQLAILLISFLIPMIVGFAINSARQDGMATVVWLVGLIWMLIISLYVLDMPTGPGQCLHCDATEKLSRTLFSLPKPSGLIDDDGPFLGTWPAAALLGYAIGARIALRPKR